MVMNQKKRETEREKKEASGAADKRRSVFTALISVIIFVGVEVSGSPWGAHCTPLTPCHKIKLQGKEKISLQ